MSFYTSLFISVLYILIIGYFVILGIQREFQQKIKNIKETYHKNQKEIILSDINRIVNRVKNDLIDRKKHLRFDIQNKAENIRSALDALEKDTKDHKHTGKNSLSVLSTFLNNQMIDDEHMEITIIKEDGIILFSNDNTQNLINKNINTLKFNKMELKTLETLLHNKGDIYTDAIDLSGRCRDNMLNYVIYCNALKALIFTSVDINKSNENYKRKFLQSLSVIKYNSDMSKYLFVLDDDLNFKLSAKESRLIGKNMSSVQVPNIKNTLKLFMNSMDKDNHSLVTYMWINPLTSKIEEKYSYIYHIKELQLMIGTGYYRSTLDKLVAQERNIITENRNVKIKRLIILLGILFPLSVVMSYYISNQIKKMEIAEKKNLKMKEQYQNILDESSIVSKTDLDGNITYVNDRFCTVSQYSREELIGTKHNIVRHPGTPIEVFERLWSTILQGNTFKGVLRNKRKDGSGYFVDTTIMPIVNEKGEIIEFISASNDITMLIQNQELIDDILNTDSLTGIGNRMKLLNDIDESSNPSLILVDINNFYLINEAYGHAVGDKCLKIIAQHLFESSKENYNVYRLYADIFAILSNRHSLDELKLFTDKSLEKAALFLEKEMIKAKLTFTLGAVSNEKDNLLAYANIALTNAKKHKERYEIFDHEDKDFVDAVNDQIRVVKLLNECIEKDRVTVLFQPIYDLNTNEITKYEALMRLIDDDGKLMTPDKFLEISKQTKIYPKLTHRIIEKAIEYFKDKEFSVSINLSLEDIMNDETVNFLILYAEMNKMANRIIIEIVETEEIKNYNEIRSTIRKLKDAGIRISIDDFGSGYSNYDYLIKLTADYIKIDSSIIQNILINKKAEDILFSIINFAKNAGMKTVAEFISSQELFNYVKNAGIDYAQGYYIGKPQKDID